MIAQFSIVPLDRGESVSEWVAKVLEKVERSGLDYRLTPMATVVEGDFDQVMDLIRDCHKLIREHSQRVVTNISIDDREGALGRLTGKINSVQARLDHDLKK